jgi:ribonuclease BN (tRNA processing enzyme)
MKLVLLGTTGYHPNDRRQTACMMLPEIGVILDAGTAMYRVYDYLATSELDIFITHAHLDHVIGLTFLFDILRDQNVRRVTVHGEPLKLTAIREHLLSPLIFPVPLPCEYEPLTPQIALPQGGTLTHFPLKHPGSSIGYRLDWLGRSLAYVTDTVAEVDAPYLEAIRGVDVLVHECYFDDSFRDMALLTGHSHTTPVAEVARQAGVGRLVLVHVNPQSNEVDPIGLATAQAIFPNTIIGEDLMEIEF